MPNFNKQANELETVEDQWSYVLKHAFASKAEIEIKNDAVTEALDRIRKTEKDALIAALKAENAHLKAGK